MKLIFQPFTGSSGADLIEAVESGKYKSLSVVVAYAKMSGVSAIVNSLENFRERGGHIKIIVGIDQKNTSIEAIRRLRELSDEMFVWHDENESQTFHPKCYLLEGEEGTFFLMVGSSNLTLGGLDLNYEMNLAMTSESGGESGKRVYERLLKGITEMTASDIQCCKEVDEKLVEDLIDRGYIFSEEKIRAARSEHEQPEKRRKSNIFGTRKIKRTLHLFGQSKPREVQVTKITSVPEGIAMAKSGFWKKLSGWDVSSTSSPGQIQIPKQFKNMFPTLVGYIETSSGGEQADVHFNIVFTSSDGDIYLVKNVRLIHYLPAENHPRPNDELRFTFLNKTIFSTLEKGDILEFRRTVAGSETWFVIRLHKNGTVEHKSLSESGKKFDYLGV